MKPTIVDSRAKSGHADSGRSGENIIYLKDISRCPSQLSFEQHQNSGELDLFVSHKTKTLYGHNLQFYCFCFSASKVKHTDGDCLEIPMARFFEALQLMTQIYVSDKLDRAETFTQWRLRRGLAYFQSLLSDLIMVNESDVLELEDLSDIY